MTEFGTLELTIAAAEEQERRLVGVDDADLAHQPDGKRMVARIVLGMQIAVDVGDHVGQNRGSRGPRRPVQVGKLVDPRLRKDVADVLLILAQNVDAEAA